MLAALLAGRREDKGLRSQAAVLVGMSAVAVSLSPLALAGGAARDGWLLALFASYTVAAAVCASGMRPPLLVTAVSAALAVAAYPRGALGVLAPDSPYRPELLVLQALLYMGVLPWAAKDAQGYAKSRASAVPTLLQFAVAAVVAYTSDPYAAHWLVPAAAGLAVCLTEFAAARTLSPPRAAAAEHLCWWWVLLFSIGAVWHTSNMPSLVLAVLYTARWH